MARIVPIDVIKSMHGKYGSNSNDYFATNSSSGRIRLAKVTNPYTGDPSEAQKEQQMKFKDRQAVATAWLNANRPNAENGPKGTPLYQQAQKLKRTFRLSHVTQVIYKYMDADNVVQLPGSADSDSGSNSGTGGNGGSGGTGSDSGSETPATKYTITGASANSTMGSVTPASTTVDSGTSVTLTATPQSGYKFSQWDDGNMTNPRTVVATADKTYTATFVVDETSGGDEGNGEETPPFS